MRYKKLEVWCGPHHCIARMRLALWSMSSRQRLTPPRILIWSLSRRIRLITGLLWKLSYNFEIFSSRGLRCCCGCCSDLAISANLFFRYSSTTETTHDEWRLSIHLPSFLWELVHSSVWVQGRWLGPQLLQGVVPAHPDSLVFSVPELWDSQQACSEDSSSRSCYSGVRAWRVQMASPEQSAHCPPKIWQAESSREARYISPHK